MTTRPSFAGVLATDGVDEKCIQIFQQKGHQVDVIKTLPETDLIKIIGNYDGLVVRSATKVTPNVLKHATKMKIIGRAGVGVDNINVTEATKCGIMVMNTPGGNTVSTAQLTVSLMCALARKIPAADMSIKEVTLNRCSGTGICILLFIYLGQMGPQIFHWCGTKWKGTLSLLRQKKNQTTHINVTIVVKKL